MPRFPYRSTVMEKCGHRCHRGHWAREAHDVLRPNHALRPRALDLQIVQSALGNVDRFHRFDHYDVLLQ